MTKSLTEFDELNADISEMVAPTLKIQVSDFASSQVAIDAAKQVKDLIKRVETKRKELVGPLNDRVREINDYAKLISAPLLKSEQHIKAQLVVFEIEQEKLREAERRRLEEEKQRQIEALQAKQQAELPAVTPEEDEWFGSGDDAQAAARALEEKHALEQVQIKNEVQAKAWDIDQRGIKNAKKVWRCEAVDLSKVPREFLKIELNTQAVLAAARGGLKEIPGVRLWQETTVAIGARTYVPQAALEETE